MSKPTGFHVRHDLRPNLARELLQILQAHPIGCDDNDIRQTATAYGYDLRQRKNYAKLLLSLKELEVVEHEGEVYTLNHHGQVIANMSTYYPYLLPEFIHFLYYTSWDNDENKRFSWSYYTVILALWQSAPGLVDRDYLVNLVMQQAQERFAVNSISFSTSSIVGILNWLGELQPACLLQEEKVLFFKLRPYCSVELFTLALYHTWNKCRNDSLYVSISDTLRQQVCQICLIPIEAFTVMFSQAEDCFPALHVRRERGERFSLASFSWKTLMED